MTTKPTVEREREVSIARTNFKTAAAQYGAALLMNGGADVVNKAFENLDRMAEAWIKVKQS